MVFKSFISRTLIIPQTDKSFIINFKTTSFGGGHG
jgi:hypothetical protein